MNHSKYQNLPRCIGYIEGKDPEPLIVITVGIHGNEPAGLSAFRAVLDVIKKNGGLDKGTLVGIVGNRDALKISERFIDEDMNRIWKSGWLERLVMGSASSDTVEKKESIDLYREVQYWMNHAATDKRVLLDIHSFSSQGPMFFFTECHSKEVDMLASFGLPIVYGITSQLKGTIYNFFSNIGFFSMILEAGNHQDTTTVDNAKMVIIRMLYKLECIPDDDIYYDKLGVLFPKNDTAQYYDVIHSHVIKESDEFQIDPKVRNFHSVSKGSVVGRDKIGDVCSPYDGYVLMPLFQRLGSEGFFIVQKRKSDRKFWIAS